MTRAVEELRAALFRLHSAVDAEVMGDTDIDNDESPLMLAMQEAARLTRNWKPKKEDA